MFSLNIHLNKTKTTLTEVMVYTMFAVEIRRCCVQRHPNVTSLCITSWRQCWQRQHWLRCAVLERTYFCSKQHTRYYILINIWCQVTKENILWSRFKGNYFILIHVLFFFHWITRSVYCNESSHFTTWLTKVFIS